jgi:hypothetical protein
MKKLYIGCILLIIILSNIMSYYIGSNNKSVTVELDGNPVFLQTIKLKNNIKIYIGYDPEHLSVINEVAIYVHGKQILFENFNKNLHQVKVFRRLPQKEIYYDYYNTGSLKKIDEYNYGKKISTVDLYNNDGSITESYILNHISGKHTKLKNKIDKRKQQMQDSKK